MPAGTLLDILQAHKMENEYPVLKKCTTEHAKLVIRDGKLKNVTAKTVFELIRNIKDPEHPYSLEQLGVVSEDDIWIEAVSADVICLKGLPIPSICVVFTPTVPHCSLAGIIGLSLIYQIEKYTTGYWIRVSIKKETHSNYIALNKQLQDRDRVMAAFENDNLLDILTESIEGTQCDES